MIKLLSLLFTTMILTGCGSTPEKVTPVMPTNGKTPIILALGDSLTAGYNLPPEESYTVQLEALLRAEGYSHSVRNAGISGDTTAQLLARLDWTIGTDPVEHPTLAIVEIGANDAFQGIDPSTTEANIRSILKKLVDLRIPTLLTGMKAPPNLGRAYGAKFESIYPRLADEFKVPLMEFFLQDVAAVPALNLGDGIHPTREGYAIVAKNVFDSLLKNSLITK